MERLRDAQMASRPPASGSDGSMGSPFLGTAEAFTIIVALIAVLVMALIGMTVLPYASADTSLADRKVLTTEVGMTHRYRTPTHAHSLFLHPPALRPLP